VPYADDEVAVFTTAGDGRVVAFARGTGAKLWERRLDLPREHGALGLPFGHLVSTGDVVVVPAWDLYALDKKTGAMRWKFSPPDDFPGVRVTLGDDGRLYSVGHHVYRLDAATGEVLWRVDLGERPFSPVVREGVVYVGTRGVIPGSSGVLGAGHAVALEAETGRLLWKTPIPAPDAPAMGGVTGAGALTPDLYIVASPSGRVYALNRRTGAVRWEYRGSGPYDVGVVVLGDVAVVASGAGYVEGLDLATGQERWKVRLGSTFTAPITRLGDLALVSSGRLVAIDARGSIRWGYGGAGWNQPIILTGAGVHEGAVYVGGESGFYALKPPS
ncbi:MAG: PQQ-binding-like beta-propeller repeat protein, partial [Gemmatimonadota bacterium]|nr:PQQ-binding-like beta-propeller repeat protein [Gemmatimonadota bacterium]